MISLVGQTRNIILLSSRSCLKSYYQRAAFAANVDSGVFPLKRKLTTGSPAVFSSCSAFNDASLVANKRFVNEDSLVKDTERLISFISGGDGLNVEHSNNDRTSHVILRAWVREAQRGHSILAAQQAHRLLDALRENAKNLSKTKTTQIIFLPDLYHYSLVLKAYANCGGTVPAATAAEDLLHKMLQDCHIFLSLNHDRIKFYKPPEPNIYIFNIVLRAWAKCGHEDARGHAEAILELMKEWREFCVASRVQNPHFPYEGCTLDKFTLVSMIETFSRSRNGPEAALQLVVDTINTWREDNNKIDLSTKLDAHVFNALMHAWLKQDSGLAAARKVEQIFNIMKETGVIPDEVSYNILVNSWAHAEVDGLGYAAQQAEDILTRLIRQDSKDASIKIQIHPFNSCISAWSRCYKRQDAPERAEQVYKMLVQLYEETGDKQLMPNEFIASSLISAWTRATDRVDSMDRALALLERQKRYSEPGLRCYSTIIDGYARRGNSAGAEKILQKLFYYAKNLGKTELRPSAAIYNSVFLALARENAIDSAVRAENLLQQMKQEGEFWFPASPNTATYATVINVLTKLIKTHLQSATEQANAASKAESYLDEMLFQYRQGKKLKPNDVCFISCIAAWAECYLVPDSAERAERIYDTLIQLYEESRDVELRPCKVASSTVIYAWANAIYRPDSMDRALAVLERTKRFVEPDLNCYNTLLRGYGRRRMSGKALYLLQWLSNRANNMGERELQPSLLSYNSVLATFANEKSPQSARNAESLLAEMKRDFKNFKGVKPNSKSYAIVIDALSQALINDQFLIANILGLMQEMIAEYSAGDPDMVPDTYFLTIFLKKCVPVIRSDANRMAAMNVAMEAFGALRSSDIKPAYYLLFLRSIGEHVKDYSDRHRLLHLVLDRCSREGHLTSKIHLASMKCFADFQSTKPQH